MYSNPVLLSLNFPHLCVVDWLTKLHVHVFHVIDHLGEPLEILCIILKLPEVRTCGLLALHDILLNLDPEHDADTTFGVIWGKQSGVPADCIHSGHHHLLSRSGCRLNKAAHSLLQEMNHTVAWSSMPACMPACLSFENNYNTKWPPEFGDKQEWGN